MCDRHGFELSLRSIRRTSNAELWTRNGVNWKAMSFQKFLVLERMFFPFLLYSIHKIKLVLYFLPSVFSGFMLTYGFKYRYVFFTFFSQSFLCFWFVTLSGPDNDTSQVITVGYIILQNNSLQKCYTFYYWNTTECPLIVHFLA